jgi:hypothetical protein
MLSFISSIVLLIVVFKALRMKGQLEISELDLSYYHDINHIAITALEEIQSKGGASPGDRKHEIAAKALRDIEDL